MYIAQPAGEPQFVSVGELSPLASPTLCDVGKIPGPSVGVFVEVGVSVGVFVGVGVRVDVGLAVAVGVAVSVGTEVSVGVDVLVWVAVATILIVGEGEFDLVCSTSKASGVLSRF
jgi:hypothetical protein